MNALNLDVWPSIYSKSSQSSGTLSATSASLDDSASGCQPPSSNNEILIDGDAPTLGGFQGLDRSPEHSLGQEWYSSSSDEAEDTDFKLEGLRPRPISGDEQRKKCWQLIKEQRWAEAKLAFELGIVFDSKVKRPNSKYGTLMLRNHPLLSVMDESCLSAAITVQTARNRFHQALCRGVGGNNQQTNSLLSLWLATQAHVAAREYANLLSHEIRETAVQQGFASQDQLTGNGESMINEIGCAAWEILASVEWKKYVDDVTKGVISNVNAHVRDIDEAVLPKGPLCNGPGIRKKHKESGPRIAPFPGSFFIVDENDHIEFTSSGLFISSSSGLASGKWWEYLETDGGAVLESKIPANPHSVRGPISRVVRFGKLEPHMVNKNGQEQGGSYYLLTMCPLVLRNRSKVVRKHIGALLNVTTMVRFSVVDKILGGVDDVVDTEQVQCQDAAITEIQSSAKDANSRAAFEKLRGLDGAVRMEGGASIHTKQSKICSGSSLHALYEVVSEGTTVFDQVSGQPRIATYVVPNCTLADPPS